MIKLRKFAGKYGAPMGRINGRLCGECIIEKMPLEDGYDSGGAYWGYPSNLYVAEDAEGDQCYVRAESMASAKNQVKELNTNFEITFRS